MLFIVAIRVQGVEVRATLAKAEEEKAVAKAKAEEERAAALEQQTYKDVPALISQAKDGQATTLYNDALRQKEQQNYKEAERLLNEAIQVGGKVPWDLAAELKSVTALRDEAEKAEAERIAQERARQERIDRQAGPKPENSAWDAAVEPVVTFLKANLKDPKSVEYIEWSPVTLLELKGEFYWAVRVRYRARNSFGGMVIEHQVFTMRHNRVVDYTDL